ncbi:hypothetical protein [Pelagicoccus sp. SDUM812005]|uniref:hypothetical protein n=1 Tax=Pelagicoccus sp. SDUM812005 TaxID=3041257 RepID=UPI00280E1F4D|nr:hypothetical protein [Pelagicoccus sp. SDUM812005]MDQ8182673.1 hypothetical protein [Pelagicoccus sp. SDUM812005]
MYFKAILWGSFLFSLALVGEQARLRILQNKLHAEHHQRSPLSIHKSGTILKFSGQAHFEIPLQAAIDSAVQHGYSDSLLRYLSHRYGEILPYWETPTGLRFELDHLTQHLIKERVFTVVHPITGQRHHSFQILPESEHYYFAYAYEDGTTFYEEEKPDFHLGPYCLLELRHLGYAIAFEDLSREPFHACLHRARAPKPPTLQLNTNHIQPDLSTEFLRILANPDPTVF